MKVYKIASSLHNWLNVCKQEKLQVGFVPTMGALHEGHVSLLEASLSKTDITVCSIYVNPKQFGDPTDLEKYPRPIESDLLKLEKIGVDAVFIPADSQVYPPDYKNVEMVFDGLDHRLEGKQRPGHFQGVVNVLNQLFRIVRPDFVFLGQKDFQQTVVVQQLIRQKGFKIDLVVCPIIREPNGLAMSSRNIRLEANKRLEAQFIYSTLKKIKTCWLAGQLSSCIEEAKLALESHPDAELEYLMAVDREKMLPLELGAISKSIAVVCVVKYCGVRLLDNIILK